MGLHNISRVWRTIVKERIRGEHTPPSHGEPSSNVKGKRKEWNASSGRPHPHPLPLKLANFDCETVKSAINIFGINNLKGTNQPVSQKP